MKREVDLHVSHHNMDANLHSCFIFYVGTERLKAEMEGPWTANTSSEPGSRQS